MKTAVPALVTSFVLLGLSWITPVAGQQRVERDLVYRWHFGTALLMDVYYPEQSNGAGIIWINGSGFHAAPPHIDWELKGAERMYRAQPYLDAGFTLFSINHRAAPAFRYPAAIDDAQRAVRFVRANARHFGIDPSMIAARGTSSGGHLVSLLGTLDGEGDPGSPDPIDRMGAKVSAVVAIRASYDMTKSPDWPSSTYSGATSFIGTTYEQAPQLYAEASPISHVSAHDAAFLIIHGDADDVIPLAQAEEMRDSLEAVGLAPNFVRLAGAGHGWRPSVYDESHAAAWLTQQVLGPDNATELQPLFDAHRELVRRWETVEVHDVDAALALLTQAQSSHPRVTVPGWYWNRVCWRGATQGRAEDVIEACNNAVKTDPENHEFRESRGLARALVGDPTGAISDFEFFLSRILDQDRHNRRVEWVDQLRAGQNPFTPQLLLELRTGG
jgi:acetyl esterase/lipase